MAQAAPVDMNKIVYISEDFLKPAKASFKPYIFVLSELRRPTSIFMAAAVGGNTKFIALKNGTDTTLSDVRQAIRDYLKKYRGHCGLFGMARSFLWVRNETEATLLDLDGTVLGERSGQFWPQDTGIQTRVEGDRTQHPDESARRE
jgi:hypothetical protein